MKLAQVSFIDNIYVYMELKLSYSSKIPKVYIPFKPVQDPVNCSSIVISTLQHCHFNFLESHILQL